MTASFGEARRGAIRCGCVRCGALRCDAVRSGFGGGGGAGGAEAVEEELVAGELKAQGNRGGDGGQDTAGEVVDAAAVAAVEVVVMAFAGDFVAGGFAGDLDGREPALGDERVDVAVDGGHADAVDEGLSGGEGFVGREGARRLLEGGTNGVFLAGFSEAKAHAGIGGLLGWKTSARHLLNTSSRT